MVPADDKENAQLVISQTILDTLKSLKISYPKLDAQRHKEMQKMRKTCYVDEAVKSLR